MSSVGVVIPCYRYGHLLEECVQSALRDQPGIDVKVLIIDDASPDDSAQRAKDLANEDPRIEVWVHPENRGHIRTYNEGLLEWADTDHVTLLSADDRLTPGALTRAAQLLDAHPNVGFVYGHPIHFDPEQPIPPARTRARGSTVWDGQWWLARRFREGHGNITSPEVVVRTSLQQKVGGYREDLPHTGDIEMWMRLAAHADVGYIKGADQAYYRTHAASMSNTRYSGKLNDLVQRRTAYLAVLETCPVDDPKRLEAAIRRRLAVEAVYEVSRAYDRSRTHQVPIDELVDFAVDTWPGIVHTWTYRGLLLRRRIGAKRMPWLQPLIVSAPLAHARRRVWKESWRRRGI